MYQLLQLEHFDSDMVEWFLLSMSAKLISNFRYVGLGRGENFIEPVIFEFFFRFYLCCFIDFFKMRLIILSNSFELCFYWVIALPLINNKPLLFLFPKLYFVWEIITFVYCVYGYIIFYLSTKSSYYAWTVLLQVNSLIPGVICQLFTLEWNACELTTISLQSRYLLWNILSSIACLDLGRVWGTSGELIAKKGKVVNLC